MPRPDNIKMLTARLEREPEETRTEKKLELQLAGLLFLTGISQGEALRVAEVLHKTLGPRVLAEKLHQIANEYLTVRA
jgi:hypothetical protein